ncbi:MAG: helix-turn-helix transcriptional regulator [Clostridia bacterium]|nr:helix-turn-helix transcriptional regulator [Clostridia bacterium]
MDVDVLWVADHIAYAVEAHTHEFYHMIICKQKGGKIYIGENEYKAKNDYIYFVKPGELHSMTRGSDMRLIEIKFLVKDDTLNKHLAAVPQEFQLEDVLFMKSILQQIVAEGLSNDLYSSDAANSALKLFLAHTARKFDNNSVSVRDKSDNHAVLDNISGYEKSNGDIMILNLERYIQNNLHREITLTELADKVGFNKTYFVKRFKILWGMPPMQFVNSQRLEVARRLLTTTDMSVSEIAEVAGFRTLHYFSRAFKRNTGISPTEYYKKYRL